MRFHASTHAHSHVCVYTVPVPQVASTNTCRAAHIATVTRDAVDQLAEAFDVDGKCWWLASLRGVGSGEWGVVSGEGLRAQGVPSPLGSELL